MVRYNFLLERVLRFFSYKDCTRIEFDSSISMVELFTFFCYNVIALKGARPLHPPLYLNIKAVWNLGTSQVSLTGEE